MGDIEEFRRQALAERRKMQLRAQEEAKKKAKDLEIGAITSDNPVDWDPDVRRAKADLIEAKSLLGCVPPSMYEDAVEACEDNLRVAVEAAEQKLREKK